MRTAPNWDHQGGGGWLKAALGPALGAAVILVLMAVGYAPAHGAGLCRGQVGIASFYSYTGHRTANGERFTGSGFTAASRSLPFGARVRVTNLQSGRSVVVRINDRGPYVRGRILDLSRAAARAIGLSLGRVCIERL